VAAGIRNGQDPDFGTTELWLLDEVQQICSAAGFPDPLPTYKSRHQMAVDKGVYIHCGSAKDIALAASHVVFKLVDRDQVWPLCQVRLKS